MTIRDAVPEAPSHANTLSDLGVASKDAYNVEQGVREMSGQGVIAEIRTQEAETRAEIAVLASKIDANTAHIAALDSRLDGMGWTVSATLALVVALTAARLLNWIAGCWGNPRAVRILSSE